MCTPDVSIDMVPFKPGTSVKDMSKKEYKQLQKTNKCRVSKAFYLRYVCA
jgi:hypothetical protein